MFKNWISKYWIWQYLSIEIFLENTSIFFVKSTFFNPFIYFFIALGVLL